jgi:pimeloyl-ACP methyl ester carboxylesterase
MVTGIHMLLDRLLLVVSVMGVAISPLAVARGAPTPTLISKAKYDVVACDKQIVATEHIECGFLTVPENRNKPRSNTIRLPVVIFRSRASQPAADPVIFVPGGPGVSNVEGRTTGKGNPFLEQRDFILLETRGTQHAKPALECPEIDLVKRASAADMRPDDSDAMLKAAQVCRRRLEKAGVDLDGYTSAEAADDLEDLRIALGIKQWNMVGLSYGTKLVLTTLQRHPDGVRSVVLDSVLPPDVNYDEVANANLQRSLDLVFTGCSAEPTCNAANPDLAQKLHRLVSQADRDGIEVWLPSGPRRLSGAGLMTAIGAGLGEPALIPSLPGVISDTAQGRVASLSPLLALAAKPSTFSWGMRLSVWCAEEMPFEDAGRMGSQALDDAGFGGLDARTTTPAICKVWNVRPADATANEPVESAVPALVLAGEFDPSTPPNWGRRLLRTMPNARFVLVPGQSHGALFNRCGGQMALAFLQDPAAALPIDCIAKMPGANFGQVHKP